MRNSFGSVVLSVVVVSIGLPGSAGESPAAAPTLRITRDRICPGAISPYQYGQFIEYLCGLTQSMFAEQVSDGSFEGVPPYNVSFRKELDRIEQPWYPDGAVHRGDYALDPVNPFNGKVSQRISQKNGDPCTLGISQGEKYVKAGQAFRCVIHLRANGTQHPVVVAIWGHGKTYTSAEFNDATGVRQPPDSPRRTLSRPWGSGP
jgi:hypothetical protein